MERHFHRRNFEEAAQQLPKATPVIVEADETVPYGRVMGTLKSCAAPASQIFPLL